MWLQRSASANFDFEKRFEARHGLSFVNSKLLEEDLQQGRIAHEFGCALGGEGIRSGEYQYGVVGGRAWSQGHNRVFDGRIALSGGR